jgi:mercuric ion transport protein
MTDRALIQAGTAGIVLAAICCAAPLIAISLPLAGFGAWLAGTGLVVLPPMAAGLVVWGLHLRRAKATGCETRIHREGVKL